MDNFLRSPVLPGEITAKHEHRRMLTVLFVVLIVAIIVGAALLWSSSNKGDMLFVPTTTRPESDIERLNRSAVTMTEQEKIDVALDLSWSGENLTDKQKSDIAAKLLKAVE